MEIYNTLTRKKELFEPCDSKKIQMFVCGPTVYDYIHIGNARTFVFFDVVAKYLRYRGYDLNYIQNITDIDNKIIERAEKEGVDSLEYAKKYNDIFKDDMLTLGITSPEYKNATDHIPEVIKQVQTLLDKGNAYVIESDGIYFDLSTFPDYGKLSGRTANMADDAVSRIDDSDKKRNRGDFALWKFSQAGDPNWPAPFGAGRPGWHIEDTAITEKYFGPQYNIHGGGQDLIFPHHEAEIAQQESASGLKPFVKYWMHSGFLINKDSKMSKSLGNFETANELLKKYSPEAVRYYLLSAHYRSPLAFEESLVQDAKNRVDKLAEFWLWLQAKKEKVVTGSLSKFEDPGLVHLLDALDNDFDTPAAFAEISRRIEKYNQEDTSASRIFQMESMMKVLNDIFGIVSIKKYELPKEIKEARDKNEQYRKDGNFVEADKTRKFILDQGFKLSATDSLGTLVIPDPTKKNSAK